MPRRTPAIRLLLLVLLVSILQPAPHSSRLEQWLDAAEQAAQRGQYDEAVAFYTQIIEQTGPRAEWYERLVQWSLDSGHDAEARIFLYALADLDGWTPARIEQLRLILTRDKLNGPVNALLYASLEGNNNPEALRLLALQQMESSDWDAARQTLERWVAVELDDAEAAYLLGLVLAPVDRQGAEIYLERAMAKRDWVQQAQAVREALGAYETEPLTDAHTALGMVLVRLTEWASAERIFKLAVEANAVNSLALAYLGFVRDQRGGDGLPDLQTAIEMDPNNPTLHYLLGLHWRQRQNHQAAYDAFEDAYALSPANPALAAEMGASLQALDDLVGAEEWMRVAVDLEPGNPVWRRLLAAFYADTGFLLEEAGLAFIQESNEVAPDDADLMTSLGWAYYQTGEDVLAFETLNRALLLDPGLPRTRYYFGLLLERRGDPSGAADSYWYVVNTVGADEGYGRLAARALQRLGYAVG